MGIRRIRMFLGLQDPDPSFRGTDPDPDPSHFWNNACKIGFKHIILAKKLIFKTEDNVPVGML
jgi:hypothetical protein